MNRDASPTTTRPVARLALEDGTVFTGFGFGRVDLDRPTAGEVVFNTGMTGYQEILTDPSYAGQIVTMTYPHIGNYGINREDVESARVHAVGLVVRELAEQPSNHRSTATLDAWLREQGVPAITGIDTRALTRKLRIDGAMRGVLAIGDSDPAELVRLARSSPEMTGRNLAEEVSPREPNQWSEDLGAWRPLQGEVPAPDRRLRVVAIDCGAKSNILRNLTDRGCEVTVVPHDTPAERILEMNPDGLFLSNGPGDPEAVDATIRTLKTLHGICLGHQLLGLAMGAGTFKLKFGHHGCNQPVQNLATGKVEITSQNHGFAVDADSLEAAGATATHVNLNDRTLEGFRHKDLPVFAVQYHPEAAPGPHDAAYLFDCFIDMMQTGQSPTGQQMDTAQRRRNKIEPSEQK